MRIYLANKWKTNENNFNTANLLFKNSPCFCAKTLTADEHFSCHLTDITAQFKG